MENSFWTKIEGDLSIEIPNFIKNGFNYCGFKNALSFKNVTDSHIDAVEEFIRTNISNVVQSENAEDLYGPFYARNPQRFAFLAGDRELIKQLASHVRDIVDQNGKNSGLHHFQSNESKHTEPSTNHSKRPYLLNKLISTADQNSNRKKGAYRYDSEIQKISTLIRMSAGPLGYRILQSNLEGVLPSLPSVNRYIHASNYHITEGVLRTEELRDYLNERRLPNVVCLSEDATRVTPRPQYDSRTNQIVGLTLPTDSKTGMPIPLQFPARSATEMMNHFANGNVSGFLNVVVAQPVLKGAASFCLLVYGSDCKYSAMDVKNRWKYIENELGKIGIEVLTWSSDSDPRYNAAMRCLSKLGMKSKIPWFSMSEDKSGSTCIQDTVHVVTKLRNLLLRTKWAKKQLFFGKFKIDMAHLYILLYKYSKDIHQLTESVLNPADRQNFLSAQRMCDRKVIELLQGVENSEGTSLYLQMMQGIMSAFMDPNLTPLERVRHIWFPLFIIRIWRQYIKNHKLYTLKDNFLTMNCYCCIELNAHGLIQLIVYLKKSNRPHLFLPELFSSQPCESEFRQFRSFSPQSSTVINCTVKEAASRISKIQLQGQIMDDLSKNFSFPSLKKFVDSDNNNCSQLPSNSEIISEIEKCQQDAIIIAKKIGLITRKPAKNYTCELKPHTLEMKNIKKRNRIKPKVISQLQHDKYAGIDLNNIKLKDYSGKLNDVDIGPTSPYVVITDDYGKQTVTRKTSLCWLLRPECVKLSSDRLIRVRADKSEKTSQVKCTLTDTKLKKKSNKCKQNKGFVLRSHK